VGISQKNLTRYPFTEGRERMGHPPMFPFGYTRMMLHYEPKKLGPFSSAVTSPNVDRLSKFFHCLFYDDVKFRQILLARKFRWNFHWNFRRNFMASW